MVFEHYHPIPDEVAPFVGANTPSIVSTEEAFLDDERITSTVTSQIGNFINITTNVTYTENAERNALDIEVKHVLKWLAAPPLPAVDALMRRFLDAKAKENIDHFCKHL